MKKLDNGKVMLEIGDMFGGTGEFPAPIIKISSLPPVVETEDDIYSLGLLGLDYYCVNFAVYDREDILLLQEVESIPDDDFEPITLNNIVKVLEYNNVDKNIYTTYPKANAIKFYVRDFKSGELYGTIVNLDNPLWLHLIEVYTGKLKPLPKLDYYKQLKNGGLVNNGFYQIDNLRLDIDEKNKKFELILLKSEYDLTEENLDFVISSSKFLKELK